MHKATIHVDEPIFDVTAAAAAAAAAGAACVYMYYDSSDVKEKKYCDNNFEKFNPSTESSQFIKLKYILIYIAILTLQIIVIILIAL